MPKRDMQATEAKHFKEAGSFVFKDGREWLEGRDWDARRMELLERCGGRCEYTYQEKTDNPAHRCTQDAADAHHKVLRSVSRDDRMSNLMAVCRPHHELLTVIQRNERGKNKINFKAWGHIR